MKIAGRTIEPFPSFAPSTCRTLENIGVLMLSTIDTEDDLEGALDNCVRAYIENLDNADLDTYMGVMQALDSIKRRVLKTLLTPEGDPQ